MSCRVAQLAFLLLLCSGAYKAEPGEIWLDVPYVSQQKNGCGAASVAMLMRYWQRQRGQAETADAVEIHRVLYSRTASGTYASDLQRYLRQHGFRTFVINGEWHDLKHHLEKGRPLILALKTGDAAPHYVVVTGMIRREDIVLKHDPARRKLLKQHRTEFEREWAAAGNWTLLAVPQ